MCVHAYVYYYKKVLGKGITQFPKIRGTHYRLTTSHSTDD